MINPRFVESGSTSLANEWVTFSRLHALMFWRQKLLYSWVPGKHVRNIKKTLFKENGLSEGWPESTYDINDALFAASPRDVAESNHSLAVLHHPASRAMEIPISLAENRDNCANTWQEMTGRDWGEYTLKELIQELSKRKDLLIASHWWCPQEYCLYLHVDSYTKTFRAEDQDGIAWWLGENGIQVIRNDEKPETINPNELAEGGELKGNSLRDIVANNRVNEWRQILDIETYDLIQGLYEKDAIIYGNA